MPSVLSRLLAPRIVAPKAIMGLPMSPRAAPPLALQLVRHFGRNKKLHRFAHNTSIEPTRFSQFVAYSIFLGGFAFPFINFRALKEDYGIDIPLLSDYALTTPEVRGC